MLGGPQAGLIAGRADLVKRIESDPFMRAFRLDKMTLAALDATLRLYRDPAKALCEIPTLRMLTTPIAELRTRAEALATRLRTIPKLTAIVEDDRTFAGGGSLPDHPIPTAIVAVTVEGMSEESLATKLRKGTPAVMGRTRDAKVIFDLRTVEPDQFDALIAAVTAAANS